MPIVGFPLVGKFRPKDIAWIDLSVDNTYLASLETLDKETLGTYVHSEIDAVKAKIGIGGYGEHRKIYEKFKHFGKPWESELHGNSLGLFLRLG